MSFGNRQIWGFVSSFNKTPWELPFWSHRLVRSLAVVSHNLCILISWKKRIVPLIFHFTSFDSFVSIGFLELNAFQLVWFRFSWLIPGWYTFPYCLLKSLIDDWVRNGGRKMIVIIITLTFRSLLKWHLVSECFLTTLSKLSTLFPFACPFKNSIAFFHYLKIIVILRVLFIIFISGKLLSS